MVKVNMKVRTNGFCQSPNLWCWELPNICHKRNLLRLHGFEANPRKNSNYLNAQNQQWHVSCLPVHMPQSGSRFVLNLCRKRGIRAFCPGADNYPENTFASITVSLLLWINVDHKLNYCNWTSQVPQ